MLDPSGVLRQGLLQLSKSDRVRDVIEKAPVSRDVVRRFVAGDSTADAVRAAAELGLTGRLSTIDNLGEDTLELAQAQTTRDAYLTLLSALGEAGLTQGGKSEVSLKLSAVGQALVQVGVAGADARFGLVVERDGPVVGQQRGQRGQGEGLRGRNKVGGH